MTTLVLPQQQILQPAIIDTFAGADASVWAAKNFTISATGAGAADINLQRGRMVTAAAGSFADYVAAQSKLGTLADVEIFGEYEFASMSAERYFYAVLRADVMNYFIGTHTGLGLKFGNTTGGVATVYVERNLVGAASNVYVGPNFNPTAGDIYAFRFRAQGTQLSLKYWARSLPEPAAWTFQFTETSITAAGMAGYVGRGGNATVATTLYLDYAQVTPL